MSKAYCNHEVPWTRQVLSGISLIQDSHYNKGLAFSDHERTVLGLHGLLPARVMTLEEQANQVMWNINRKKTALDKYQYFMSVMDSNEKLFYHVLINNVFDLMPIVYTPTVGQACQQFGYIFNRPRGMYITIKDLNRVGSVLRNWPNRVEAIVFTDGERILGLGDLGAFGMGIPIGKLALYTACAGINPRSLLPVTIDTGTNRKELLEDPYYTGLKAKRTRGDAYDALIEEFMVEASKLWGKTCLLQFEDFGNANAFRLLEKYKDRFCVFNDDIQGTASVALAGLYAAARITKKKISENVYVFFGAGSAGIGIAELIAMAICQQDGVKVEEARKCIWLVDSKGLIFKGRARLNGLKPRYAHEWKGGELTDLAEIVKAVKATALIGVSGQSKVFTAKVIKQMGANCDRPIIFPYSNPNSKAEASAAECYEHTGGRCIFASGSPWPSQEITLNGKKIKVIPAQGNNAYIFPGVALGVMSTKALHIPDQIFITAAKTLAGLVTQDMLDTGSIYPALKDIRKVSVQIAVAVANECFKNGHATVAKPEDNQLETLVRSVMFDHTKHTSYVHNDYEESLEVQK